MDQREVMMKKLFGFLIAWCFGIWFLTLTVFPIMKTVITGEQAMAILSVIIIAVFTIVVGCVSFSNKNS
jgi:ABC-type antimicrobial peptide transport system permease subunit